MQTMTETYNGWKNYPTWNVNLWLSNDEGLYNVTCQVTRDALEDADGHSNVPKIWSQDQANRFTVADRLKDFVRDELAPDLGASFAADLLGYALDEVDWDEIANAWIETVSEQ